MEYDNIPFFATRVHVKVARADRPCLYLFDEVEQKVCDPSQIVERYIKGYFGQAMKAIAARFNRTAVEWHGFLLASQVSNDLAQFRASDRRRGLRF
jgi:hypothetical protein